MPDVGHRRGSPVPSDGSRGGNSGDADSAKSPVAIYLFISIIRAPG